MRTYGNYDSTNVLCPPFVPMVHVFPSMIESEHYKIEPFEVTREESRHDFRGDVPPSGRYVRLMSKKALFGLIMSDTPYERCTNREFIKQAEGGGDILIAGLGIGMCLVPLIKNENNYRSITVVEKNEEIIKLVTSSIEKFCTNEWNKLRNSLRLSIIHEDIFNFKPCKGDGWDVIYFDIWNNICADNLKEMSELHHKFCKRKKRWMGSWNREECLYLRRYGR